MRGEKLLMAKYLLAGVGTGMAIDSTGALVVSGDTYTEGSISIEVSSEDIRGGEGNVLLGKYFHDSIMNATLTDALFSLEYLSLKMGAAITVGSNGIVLESLTVSSNQVTVAGTPVALQSFGVIGWVAEAGTNNWKKVTFTGKVASVAGLGFTEGTQVCVKYCADETAARQFIVPANVIPTELTMILQYPLFKAGSEQSLTTSYKVGTLEIKIPRFLPDPSIDLSLTSSGAATVAFSGSALPYKTTAGCQSGAGDYAIFTEIIDGATWTDNLTALAVDNADIQLASVGDTTTLQVWGVYGGNNTMTTKPVDNSLLTFTSTDKAKASVDTAGVVKAVAKGTTTLKIVATDTSALINPIEAYANVTVNGGE